MAARSWGWWTEQKLSVLSDYLPAFNHASKKSSQRVYLDLFAGQAENVSRSRDQHPISGSARRALEASPQFTKLRFFELAQNAEGLEQALQAEYPGRDFAVIPGDCNTTIAGALAELSEVNWAPTFAFLDQQTTQLKWTTIETLARFKRPDKPKVELWLLCASGLLPRGLRGRQQRINAEAAARMDAMFGTPVWREADIAWRDGVLTPAEFRAELTNLMRWRLEHDLRYQTTQVLKIENTGGHELFDMIFATDHPVGDKIMRNVAAKAEASRGSMQQRARLQRRQSREEDGGRFGLFDLDQAAPGPEVAAGERYELGYEPTPVHPPYQLSSDEYLDEPPGFFDT